MTHPLEQIADIVVQQEGSGMEMSHRLDGALLRVWVPTPEACGMVNLVCSAAGLTDVNIMSHLDEVTDTTGRGFQITVVIPARLVRSYQEALTRANALPPAPPIELGRGDG